MEKKFVSYLRVSTDRQGASGLGLDAQRAAIEAFVAGRTCKLPERASKLPNGVPASCPERRASKLPEFVEVESGGRADRPELRKALELCAATGAVLVVAKLDRLARNVAFLAALMDSGVDFVAVDNPDANRLTIHILAAVAEDERRRISERTVAALEAARERGRALGDRANGGAGTEALRRYREAHGNAGAVRAVKRRADDFAERMAGFVRQARDDGARSHRAIASWLNERGVTARNGGIWNPGQVGRLVHRLSTV